jgi:hypothetical protein
MIVKHYGPFLVVVCRSPDIEEKAILCWLWLVPPGRLDGRCTKLQCVSYTGPRLQFSRPTKSPIARDPSSIGNPFEGIDAIPSGASYLSVADLNFNCIHV